MENKWYNPDYDAQYNPQGYCRDFPLVERIALVDAPARRANLIDVEFGAHAITTDETKTIGTSGMWFCTALGANVVTADKHARFMSHMFPQRSNIRHNIKAFRDFIETIGKINQLSVHLSSTKSFTAPDWCPMANEYYILDHLDEIMGQKARHITLHHSWILDIDPAGTFHTDKRHKPSIISLEQLKNT